MKQSNVLYNSAQAGKGFGNVDTKRYTKKSLKESTIGITKPAIRRVARRGSVKRISSLINEETINFLKAFLEKVIHPVAFTEHT